MADSSKLVAIGDIHGCAASLQALLKTLDEKFNSPRTYVFVGDYIDRGLNSKLVVETLLEFEKGHDCVFLRGNHEEFLLNAYENDDEWNLWLRNGGRETITSYQSTVGDLDLPNSHYEFYKNTRLWWETEDYFFVHAGISPDKTIKENLQDPEEQEQFVWRRSHLKAKQNCWEKSVIFGHTPVHKPLVRNGMIGIDTGCVYKKQGYGTLTSVALPEMEFIQQECIDF